MDHLQNQILKINIFLACCIFLSACTSSEIESPINFNEEYLNQQITIQAPEYFNTFDTTRPIALEIIYLSDNDIVFPHNYNLRIFNRTETGWLEIKEIPTIYMQTDDVVFSSKDGTGNRETLIVDPDLTDYAQDYLLRIYIFGDMKTDNEIKQVSAYIDIKLHPER